MGLPANAAVAGNNIYAACLADRIGILAGTLRTVRSLVLRDEKDRYNAGPEGRGFSPATQWNRFHAGL